MNCAPCSASALRWSLKHAYENVAHYRKAFDAAGVHPGDLKEPADLAKFPFTTKADLRANYPFAMFAVPMERIVRVHASSGTTGKPTVVGYTKEDIETWSAVMAALDPRRRRPIHRHRSRPPTATASSRAAWARTTVPRRWARPSSR